MSKESIVRYVCERCRDEEEVRSGLMTLLKSKPDGWHKVEERLLCPECYRAFTGLFRGFINETRKSKKTGHVKRLVGGED